MENNLRADEIERGSFPMFREAVEKRIKFLTRLLNERDTVNDRWPGQKLRISKTRKGFQYYLKEKGSGENGRYLSVNDQETIRGIIKRDYDQSIREAAEKELRLLTAYSHSMEHSCVNKVYEEQSEARKAMVTPVYPTDETCLKYWDAIRKEPANTHEMTGDFYTEKGERVRSKSELLIADALYHAGIPYHYEYPLTFSGGELIYPDFTILDLPNRKVCYWEHFGRMGDSEYTTKTLQKIRCYQKNGIWAGKKLIMTFESPDVPLGTREIKGIISEYFGIP